MKKYEVMIGLEIHAELNTKTKIYCSCENRFGGEGNSRCCPVCAGMPGALPSLNRKVVEYTIRMGHAASCEIAPVLKQDRKNYFYPDLPKAYQISQHDIPLCQNGFLEYLHEGKIKRVGIRQIHIEEDAGKLLHQEGFPATLIDLNRCGVPLIEIVTEPDLRSSSEAKEFLESVRLMLLYLGISDCKMQEGSIRCDVNVSVRPEGSACLGTRCEMKNVNTFSGAGRAIDFEAARQMAILEAGGEIIQETRRWEDEKGKSTLLRSKEDAMDYRFFPEPDIPAIALPHSWIEELKKDLPELPLQKMLRYMKEYALSEKEAMQLVAEVDRSAYFDECACINKRLSKNAAHWILGEISKLLHDREIDISEFGVEPERLMALLALLDQGMLSGSSAKKILAIMQEEPLQPEEIMEREGLCQSNDQNEMIAVVEQVLNANPKAVAEYRSGRTKAMGFLMGQCMAQSKGKGNPQIIKNLLSERLK